MAGGSNDAGEHRRFQITSTKWFTLLMVVVFAAGAKYIVDDRVAAFCGQMVIIAFSQAIFQAWCDTPVTSQMIERQSYSEYLILLTNLYILWLCRDTTSSFMKGLTILVMPVYFSREARSPQTQLFFCILHLAAVLIMDGGDMTGEKVQWLVNLLIVNFVVVDMGFKKREAEKAQDHSTDMLNLNESLLLTAYDATCWGSFKTTQAGELEPMIAFGSPLLSEVFGWWKPMDGFVLNKSIITSGLDDLRDFFVEASQTRSLPVYRRSVLVSCRDARGGTFEAEFRVAPRMREDKRGEDCFFLGVRIVGEKRQSLDEPTIEGEEPPPSLSEESTADNVDEQFLPLVPQSGAPLRSWFRGLFARQQAHIEKVLAQEVRDPFDCREACWLVLTLVPGLLALRCSTSSRLEVMEATPDALMRFPGILQRPVYELTTQEQTMFLRRAFMNVLHATDLSDAPKTTATYCRDIGLFELRGGGGHARIVAVLVSTRAASPGNEQTQRHFLVLVFLRDGTPESQRVSQGVRLAGSLPDAIPIDDDIGSVTSADGLMWRGGLTLQRPYR